ncbi:MAG TPA: protease modulator HflC, partial [Roseiarcus sp.]|nr:protease modulator HflC [Roseiarcus sp.]
EANDLRAQGFEWGQEIRAKADRDRVVLLSEAQREGQIARGEADAEASRLLSDAYRRDPSFFDLYRSLQVYRAGLAGGGSTLLLSPSSDLMKFFAKGPAPSAEAQPPAHAEEH